MSVMYSKTSATYNTFSYSLIQFQKRRCYVLKKTYLCDILAYSIISLCSPLFRKILETFFHFSDYCLIHHDCTCLIPLIQVERRRQSLFPVQPKPPQGFKDYLLNRGTYLLASNASTRQIPSSPLPNGLSPGLKDLFTEQERERHRIRLQVTNLQADRTLAAFSSSAKQQRYKCVAL